MDFQTGSVGQIGTGALAESGKERSLRPALRKIQVRGNTGVAEAAPVEQRKVMKIAPETLFGDSVSGSALRFLIGGRQRDFSPKNKKGGYPLKT